VLRYEWMATSRIDRGPKYHIAKSLVQIYQAKLELTVMEMFPTKTFRTSASSFSTQLAITPSISVFLRRHANVSWVSNN